MLIYLSDYLPLPWKAGDDNKDRASRRHCTSALTLNQVRWTDVPFARVSVVELAIHYRGQRGFCLTDVNNQDILAHDTFW